MNARRLCSWLLPTLSTAACLCTWSEYGVDNAGLVALISGVAAAWFVGAMMVDVEGR